MSVGQVFYSSQSQSGVSCSLKSDLTACKAVITADIRNKTAHLKVVAVAVNMEGNVVLHKYAARSVEHNTCK